MTVLKRYRQIIAAILLAVYAFIAAPVQLWHHHTIPAKSEKKFAAGDIQLSIKKATGGLTEANCPVCSHHYSGYDNDAATFFQSQHSPFFLKKYIAYTSQIPAGISSSGFNKGPPSLI